MPELQGEEGVRQALSHAKVVSYVTEFASAETWWSAGSAEVLGLPPDSPHEDWRSLIVAADRRDYAGALDGLSSRAPSFELEYRVRHGRTGRQIWILDRGLGRFDPSGRLTGLSGVLIDLSSRIGTERRASEEAAARLAAIVESSEDAIISKSLRGVVTSWNKGAERLLGYTAEEIVGESVWKLIPEDGEQEELRILDTISVGDTIRPFDSVRLHKSGRPIHVSISVSPIRDAQGGVVGASTIARDITERRRQNQRLSENEARLRLALRSARAGAWDFDLVKRELHWSPEMFALYGLDPAEGQPARTELIARISPAHRSRAQKEFSRAILQGDSFTLEFPILRPDGTEIWTALAGDVIKNSQGRAIGARGIDQDITERKNWEKRQASLLRELSHRVKNTLAVVQSVARQTLRSSPTPRAFVDAFEGRIRSLAISHSMLTEADWSGAQLFAVIRHQVAGSVADWDKRFNLRGTEVLLAAEAATRLGLVLHELAANAVKFGSLSVPAGRVDIVWSTRGGNLKLLWRETGGPEIAGPPAQSGFGTLLVASSSLRVTRRYRRQGLICRMEMAL